jgi:hypothetical protein
MRCVNSDDWGDGGERGRYHNFHMVKPMTRSSAAALALVLAGVLGAAAGPRLLQDDVEWLDNYDAAFREARRTQKPIFLEFRCES